MFVTFSFLVIFIHLLHVSLLPSSATWPNFMILTAFALVMRRPDYLPFWLVGITFLFTDFLLSKPLGLETFLVLIGTQSVRRNQIWFREMNFVLEWATVAMMLFGLVVLREFMFFLTLAEGTPFLTWLSQLSMTILAYPIMVWVVNVLFWTWKSDVNPSMLMGRST